MESRISLPISLTIALLLAACGSTSDPADDPCADGACTSADAGVARDSGARDASVRDSGSSTSSDSGARACMNRCQTDYDCSSTCPTTSVHCCDYPTGTCYANATATCSHAPDAGAADDAGGLPYP